MTKALDISSINIKIIDAHCHPFNPDKEGSNDLRLDFNLYHEGAEVDNVCNTLTSRKLMRELAGILGEDKYDEDKIIAKRNSIYKKDAMQYINMLFKDANFHTLLLDTGYPDEEFGVDSVKFEDFKNIIPCKAREIYRIEPFIFKTLKDKTLDFTEARCAIEADMDKALENENIIGFKSVIAYFTGLDIKRNNDFEAEDAYKDYKKKRSAENEKVVRDYFIFKAVDRCYKKGIPMQFHTGMGSVPILELNKANPLMMQEFLEDKIVKKTKIILTHAGHPFHQETGMLLSSFKNLYCDVSAISTYFGAASLTAAFIKLFEMSPIDKIMFGTDGGIIPETYWFGAKQGLQDLNNALKHMIQLGWMSQKVAIKYAEMIIFYNAEKIFDL